MNFFLNHRRVPALIASIFCLLIVVAHAATPAEKKKVADEATRGLPTDDTANAEVDANFKRWSSTWMFDRYIPGSAHVADRGMKDDAYILRGMFDFARSGTRLTIPFAAAYKKQNDQYRLSNLCYNDSTSGMTDCINPNDSLEDRRAANMRSGQLLGSIVLLGMVAAMSSSEETCVKRYTFFGEPYFVCD